MKLRREAFTLLELLIAIAICSVLLVIAMVGQQRVVTKSRSAGCVQNLREIAILFNIYLADNRYVYPLSAQRESPDDPHTFWVQAITEFRREPGALNAFVCPGVPENELPPGLQQRNGGHAYVSYGINRYGIAPMEADLPSYPGYHPAVQSRMDKPSELILLVDMEDSNQPWNGWYSASPTQVNSNWDTIYKRHQSVNALYCDGHIAPLTRTQVQSIPYREMPWGMREYTHYR